MKKSLLFGLFLLLGGQALEAAPTIFSFIPLLVCPGSQPAMLVWDGKKATCAALGTGLTLQNGVLNISLPTLQWQVDSFSLSSQPTGQDTISVTTTQTPASNIVLLYYNSTSAMLSVANGAVIFTGNPITIKLPTGWQPTDSIVIAYPR